MKIFLICVVCFVAGYFGRLSQEITKEGDK